MSSATRKQWSQKITDAWQKGVESIIETGRLLIKAKGELDHGEWLPMIESDLPFAENTTQRLIKIAEHPVLSNTAYRPLLPASWRTLYELTKLDDNTLKKLLDDEKITSKTEQKEAIKFLKKKSRDTGKLRSLDAVILQEEKRYAKVFDTAPFKCLQEIAKHSDEADEGRIIDLAAALEDYIDKLTDIVKQLKRPVRKVKSTTQTQRSLQ
jgi:hypothetical protein